MKKILAGCAFILIGFLIFGWAAAQEAEETKKIKDWTLLFYTCTDNNLESYTFRDFAKLTASRIEGNAVSACLLIDTQNLGSWHIVVDGNPYDDNTISMIRLENQDMSNLDTLIHFIRETAENYPAKHYALFFQGHGSGWYLKVEEDQLVSTAKIADAIEQSGISFEIMGLDMCLMANIETAYEFRNLTKYIIASEDYGPWEGLVDPKILEQFSKETEPFNILQFMARSFIKRNEIGEENDPADISIIATNQVEKLAEFLKQYENLFLSIENLFGPKYAVDRSDTKPYYQLQDLYSLAKEAFAQNHAGWQNFEKLFYQIVIDYQQNKEKISKPYAEYHHGLSIAVNGQNDDYDTNKTYRELRFPIRLESSGNN
ncbi:MAG: clostripain-related cysteine peptidase [Candidatus Atribacteria bacterium]|nr:clostripain-related cysteine peptidase [Candidatus Atribacteria bacterium]